MLAFLHQHLFKDPLAVLLLAAAVLAFHLPLVLWESALTDHDLLTYFYPYWDYSADALRAGRLPLWNPFLFTGAPFLANSQAGVFYPLNVTVLGLEAPRAVAWSYVLHLWLASTGMYVFLRAGVRLGRLGALAGAVVFAFGGFFAAQVAHINQVQAAAWLPLLAVAFLKAYRGRSIGWLLGGGVCFGLQLTAGHPQVSYLSIVTLILLGLYEAARSPVGVGDAADSWLAQRARRWGGGIARFVVSAGYSGLLIAVLAAVGGGLAAAQLLPSFELASGESFRAGGLSYGEVVSFSLAPRDLLRAFFPTYGASELPYSEHIAYVGVAAAVLALVAVGRRRPSPYTYFFAGLLVLGLLLALGEFNPLYPGLYLLAPGFDLFRVPARWLLLFTVGASGLVAVGVDGLARAGVAPLSRRGAQNALAALCGVVLLSVVSVWALRGVVTLPSNDVLLWWLLAGLVALVLAALGPFFLRGSLLAWLLIALVGLELFFAREALSVSHPVPAQTYATLPSPLAHILRDRGLYRTLGVANPSYVAEERAEVGPQPLPQEETEAMELVRRFKATLLPNLGLRFRLPSLDGYDGGLLPTRRYLGLKGLVMDSGGSGALRVQGEKEPPIPIRDDIQGIPDPGFLGALNVKYIIADKLTDGWVDGVYHDLGVPQRLSRGERLSVQDAGWEEAAALSLATYLEGGGRIPQGTPVARVTVQDAEGVRHTWPLRAGVDTAESDAGALAHAAHGSGRAVAARRNLPEAMVYAARLDFDGMVLPRSLSVEALQDQGTLTVAGAAFVGSGGQASYTPVLDSRLVRVFTGEVKVYENLAFQERAYVASEVLVLPDEEDQLRALLWVRPGQVVLEAASARNSAGSGKPSGAFAPGGTARVVTYEAERVVVEAELAAPGYLVLTDSYYPGWRAWVDGRETQILRANYLFRAVAVSEGRHTVEFRYEPASLTIGLWVSGLSAAAVAALLAWSVLPVRGRRVPSGRQG